MLDFIYLKTTMNYQFKLALLSEEAVLESWSLALSSCIHLKA